MQFLLCQELFHQALRLATPIIARARQLQSTCVKDCLEACLDVSFSGESTADVEDRRSMREDRICFICVTHFALALSRSSSVPCGRAKEKLELTDVILSSSPVKSW